MYTFPELLKKIREESGLTQDQMRQALGVSKILITLIETGQKEPSKKFISILADKLEVRPTSITPFLFNESENHSDLSKLETSLMNFGEKLQIFLIKDRAKNLRKHV